jgi:hypothetical protein
MWRTFRASSRRIIQCSEQFRVNSWRSIQCSEQLRVSSWRSIQCSEQFIASSRRSILWSEQFRVSSRRSIQCSGQFRASSRRSISMCCCEQFRANTCSSRLACPPHRPGAAAAAPPPVSGTCNTDNTIMLPIKRRHKANFIQDNLDTSSTYYKHPSIVRLHCCWPAAVSSMRYIGEFGLFPANLIAVSIVCGSAGGAGVVTTGTSGSIRSLDITSGL